MRRRMSAALQRDQPTRTNTNLSLPLDRIYTEPVLGCGSNRKITVERRNAYGRGLAGLVGSSRRWRLLLISHAIAITKPDRWLVPNEHQPPFCKTTTKAAFGKFRSLCDWMTKVERIINDSNLVLAFSHHISFIHTSYSDEQCITQKYKGKILVLHYTFSKIYTE